LFVFPILCVLASAISLRLRAQTTSVIEGTVVDSQGLAIADVEVMASGSNRAGTVKLATDQTGSYRLPGLQPGNYSLRFTKPGFGTKLYERLPVTVNRVLTFDVALPVSEAREEIRVSATPPLIDATVSSSGGTITSRQIEDMPINGRNYLDLMQLVPGVAVNRQANAGTDAATPIFGERGGNAIFLIDGMPNSNQVDGGPSAPFDQNSILEFQVLTAGYKTEFGHGSGGVVNVVSKSGGGQWHGLASGFHRNSALDSSNVSGKSTPFLMRWDLSANLGGPIVRDRVFVFGSIERIRESRQLNFNYIANTPDFLRVREETFNQRSGTFQTRGFFKLDETLGSHHLTQQMNLANSHLTGFLPLSQATSLPSSRTNLDGRNLLLGLRDTATFGDRSNPWLLNAYLQYRGEPYSKRPTYPEAGPALTQFNLFSGLTTGGVLGDLGQVQFGAGFTPLQLKANYIASGAHVNKVVGAHDLKVGWDFERTRADGAEASNLNNQLFATVSDFAEFGPVNSGLYVLAKVSGLTAEDNSIRLRNNYDGLFAQDDWKLAKRVTLHAGMRWDNDSRSVNRANFSPRLGIAWAVTPKTVIAASWGIFYDRFRLGLARDVPAFGGANLVRNQAVSLPRLFYGVPTALPYRNLGFCSSPVLTDAQILSSGSTCPVASLPLLGVDHLNAVVAPGHAPIPSNSVVNVDNVQKLTGLTPQQFADGASAALGRQPGYFSWGGFGNLTLNIPGSVFNVPITVDRDFKTPYTRAVHIGVQREIASNLVIQAGYDHRDVRNMLGVRTTNLAFEARLPNRAGQLQPNTGSRPIHSYGPWYQGRYDGINLEIRRRMSRNLSVAAFYTWAHATDNAYRSSFVSDVQTARGAVSLASSGPTDGFVGIPPVVRDQATGQSNADGPFIASNGNPVPRAGIFYNGPNLDLGPSDLAVNHTFVLHGMVQFPRLFDLSGIFRAQSGFHFSAQARRLVDVDGDGSLNGVDFLAGRNQFQAPGYANIDLRVSRRISILEKVRVQAMLEFFNLLNRANPAAVQQLQTDSLTPLGRPLQFLPGREGQVGLRFEF
ncbi:MAG TPA: TonB-dependent receptor, partial [Bryobacteraceae bacterium]|nr:TonB-dependent receptor [Bryobacteraceae bacterium]